DEDWEGVMQGLNIEFPEEEQAEAESPAVVNSTATATESETSIETVSEEVDESMAYEEDPYELFENDEILGLTEQTEQTEQNSENSGNPSINSSQTENGLNGTTSSASESQQNQLEDVDILTNNITGDEKLIDTETGSLYGDGDVISINCGSEGFKSFMLTNYPSGVEVEWDLTDLKGTRIDNITTKSYSAIYALPYSKLKQAAAGSIK